MHPSHVSHGSTQLLKRLWRGPGQPPNELRYTGTGANSVPRSSRQP